MSKTKITNFSAAEIDRALRGKFHHREGYLYHLSNKYLFRTLEGEWESDFLVVSRKAQLFYEVEIKRDKADFFKDFEKPKHKLLQQVYDKGYCVEYRQDRWKDFTDQDYLNLMGRGGRPSFEIQIHRQEKIVLPHRFYFCYPEGLIDDSKVPPYAGIIHIEPYPSGIYNRNGYTCLAREQRKAPMIHKNKIFDSMKDALLEKFYYESLNLREKVYKLSQKKVSRRAARK